MKFKEYYIGRKGMYHNKNVVIVSTNHDIFQYEDYGFNINDLEIVIYYEDSSKRSEKLKGKQITKNLELYDSKI